MASKVFLKLANKSIQSKDIGIRYLSDNQRKGFLGGFVDNLKEEFNKNKEMKDTIKKFREEAKKLEESDALKQARDKYRTIQDEGGKSSKILKEKLGELTEKVKESDLTKKAVEKSGQFYKAAQGVAHDISKNEAMKKVSENAKAIKHEIDEVTHISSVRSYKPPKELRKRSEIIQTEQKVYESNTEAQGVVLHKDSKWFQSWNDFKENNSYVNKLFDLKAKYDESDNAFVRASKVVTDRFVSLFGAVLKKTEMSEVLTEIIKMDPNFDTNEFLKFVQTDIIPNVLESISRGELEILKDWCTETAFNVLSLPITTSKQLHMKYHTKIIDIHHVDIAAGKIMEQGPVLIVTFNAHQVMYVTDLKGVVIEGSKDTIKNVQYIWALCRDQTILDPKSSWRLMESVANATDLFI